MGENKDIIIVNAYLDTDHKIDLAYESIIQLKKSNIEILLTSHYHVPEKIKDIVDYYVYDKNNVMIEEMSDYYWWGNGNINFKCMILFAKHSYAALTSLKNGIYFAKSLGKTNFHHIEYDSILSDNDINLLKNVGSNIGDKKGYFDSYIMSNNDRGISMLYFYCNIDYFLSVVDIPSEKEDYVNFVRKNVGAISSEMFLYNKLSNSFEDLVINERIGDNISLFKDPESKIAYSHIVVGNEMNHISDITYNKNNRDELFFVFVNRNLDYLTLKILNETSVLCHNCIFYKRIYPSSSEIEYTIYNKNIDKELTLSLSVSEIIKNKRHDEYIEFI